MASRLDWKQLEFWYLQCQGLCLLFWWVWGSGPMSITKWTHQTRSGWSTWQIRWESFSKVSSKYFQGIALLAIHYILHAWLVLWTKSRYWLASFFTWKEYSRRSKSDDSSLPFLYKISWGLEVKLKASICKALTPPQNIVSTVNLFITILYWTLLHPYFVEHGMLKVWLFSNWTDQVTQTF